MGAPWMLPSVTSSTGHSIRGFMPNLQKKSWMVSSKFVFLLEAPLDFAHQTCMHRTWSIYLTAVRPRFAHNFCDVPNDASSSFRISYSWTPQWTFSRQAHTFFFYLYHNSKDKMPCKKVDHLGSQIMVSPGIFGLAYYDAPAIMSILV